MRRVFSAGLLTTVFVVLTAGLASPAAHAAQEIDYVALGDSYSSGAGAPPYEEGLCARSAQGYAQLWADTHDVSSFEYAACGGATTETMPFQLNALDAETDLVTITIGGNDVGFGSTVFSCVFGDDQDCVDAVNEGIEEVNAELPGKLDATYATIRDRSPDADVIVLGYPHLVEPDGDCLTQTKRDVLNDGSDELHEVISARASAAEFHYVDAREYFDGHGACGDSPWINEFSWRGFAEAFHPNAAGYSEGYLAMVNSVTG